VRGTDQRLVLAIGVATGLGLALRGLSPTGSTVFDWLILVVAAAAATWASASAPWWSLSAMAAIGAAVAPLWLPLVLGIGVLSLSLAIGMIRRSQPVERAAVVGVTILLLSMSRELGYWGINSLLALTLVGAVSALGLSRRSRRVRRRALTALGVVVAAATFGVLGLGVAAAAARPNLSAGNRETHRALRQLKQGDFEDAALTFRRAAGAFERASGDFDAFWAQAARLIPIASQHRRAGTELSTSAADATSRISRELAAVDFDSLQIVDGRIDIDAVKSLRQPMDELLAAVDDLGVAIDESNTGWLIAPVRTKLDELVLDIAEQQAFGDRAIEVLDIVPAMLGEDRERVYFVMFTTPAEARGQGGFMGNYAELSIDDGRLELVSLGRHSDLSSGGVRPRRLDDAPTDWIERYGRFDFRIEPDGEVGKRPWSLITLSPHFPSTAQVVAELYPQSGGRPIDGVFSLDVYVMQDLVGIVGPIKLGTGVKLNGKNTAEYLLRDQYVETEGEQRLDQLELVAEAVIDRLLGGQSPGPVELGRQLAPRVDQRRLLAWALDPDENDLFEDVGLDGSLPSPNDNSLAFAFVNAGGNKIDSFLDTDVRVRSDTAAERSTTIVELTAHNAAPTEGYPKYVIGNLFDLPKGTNRAYITVFTTSVLLSARLDGNEIEMTAESEHGLNAYSKFITVPSEASATLTLELLDPPDVAGRPIVVLSPPLANDPTWDVVMTTPAGISKLCGAFTGLASPDIGNDC
jgi:hypothetical protein